VVERQLPKRAISFIFNHLYASKYVQMRWNLLRFWGCWGLVGVALLGTAIQFSRLKHLTISADSTTDTLAQTALAGGLARFQ
jgi:hypothetical protein